MELFTLGINLGKTTFHLVGMDQRGEAVLRKRFSRVQLLHFTANLKVKLIGMEACGGSHFLGRALREQWHDVRLIPAQYVKPLANKLARMAWAVLAKNEVRCSAKPRPERSR
jgi:transposase